MIWPGKILWGSKNDGDRRGGACPSRNTGANGGALEGERREGQAPPPTYRAVQKSAPDGAHNALGKVTRRRQTEIVSRGFAARAGVFRLRKTFLTRANGRERRLRLDQ